MSVSNETPPWMNANARAYITKYPVITPELVEKLHANRRGFLVVKYHGEKPWSEDPNRTCEYASDLDEYHSLIERHRKWILIDWLTIWGEMRIGGLSASQ